MLLEVAHGERRGWRAADGRGPARASASGARGDEGPQSSVPAFQLFLGCSVSHGSMLGWARSSPTHASWSWRARATVTEPAPQRAGGFPTRYSITAHNDWQEDKQLSLASLTATLRRRAVLVAGGGLGTLTFSCCHALRFSTSFALSRPDSCRDVSRPLT